MSYGFWFKLDEESTKKRLAEWKVSYNEIIELMSSQSYRTRRLRTKKIPWTWKEAYRKLPRQVLPHYQPPRALLILLNLSSSQSALKQGRKAKMAFSDLRSQRRNPRLQLPKMNTPRRENRSLHWTTTALQKQ